MKYFKRESDLNSKQSTNTYLSFHPKFIVTHYREHYAPRENAVTRSERVLEGLCFKLCLDSIRIPLFILWVFIVEQL